MWVEVKTTHMMPPVADGVAKVHVLVASQLILLDTVNSLEELIYSMFKHESQMWNTYYYQIFK